ncbi:hypothetical protein Tco_1493245 [Tanacetum coccineum]
MYESISRLLQKEKPVNGETSQAVEIARLKERVKKLERRNKSRTLGLKRLRKFGRSAQVVSSKDEEVTLVDEAQERNNDNLMFDTEVLDEQVVEVEKVVSTAEVTIASTITTIVDELTLAQTLIEINVAKPKAVITAATTTTTAVTRPKARGVVVQELSGFTTTISRPPQFAQVILQRQGKDDSNLKNPLTKEDQFWWIKKCSRRLQQELHI